MKTNYQLIRFSILLGILIIGCKTNKASKENDEFALFTTKEVFDSTSGSIIIVPSIDRIISIASNQSLDNKVNSLLDSISKNNFNNLRIESLGIAEIRKGYKSLKVNLLENPGFKMISFRDHQVDNTPQLYLSNLFFRENSWMTGLMKLSFTIRMKK
jgi:hypothetical protein